MNRKRLKRYYSEINLLSYNNKDLILETWATLKNLDKIINHENKPIKGLESLLDETKSDSIEESEDEEMNKKRVFRDISFFESCMIIGVTLIFI